MKQAQEEIGETLIEKRRLHGNPLRELWDYRFALQNVILKDFRIRYRNMSLGILWSVLNPLVMLGVLVVVFSYIHPQRTADYFPIFLLLGLIAYNYFSLSLSAATNCIIDNAPLVKKVIFPRHILPISVVLSQAIHLLIQLCLLGLFLAVFRVPPRWTFLWIPAIYLVELVYIMGIVLLSSALNVYYRDVQYLVQSSLTVMFWFTPIFYSLDMVRHNLTALAPGLYTLYLLNPLAGCIDASRRAVLAGIHPDPYSFGVSVAVALVMFIVGATVFVKIQPNFADKV